MMGLGQDFHLTKVGEVASSSVHCAVSSQGNVRLVTPLVTFPRTLHVSDVLSMDLGRICVD